MSDFKHQTYDASANVLTTELNALANAARAISAAIDNTTALNLYDDLEFVVTFGTGPTDGMPVDLYLIPSFDGGTTYGDGDASTAPPQNHYAASFNVRSTTSAQRIVLRDVPIPGLFYKYVLDNKTGQAFAATGNTLKRRGHRYQD
jgi:hypothetical protein